MTTKGTKEWSDSSVNFQKGCKYDCKYCYARAMAIRFKQIKNSEEWSHPKIREKDVKKGYRKRKGRVMFPTSHDIYPENELAMCIVLGKLLKSGNEVLITTKPNLECIKSICGIFEKFKNQIQFRFTITSEQDEKLLLWEPNAPSYQERLQSLIYAYRRGFKTSVSIEPYLDATPFYLIGHLEPFISETIWIGVMNKSNLPPEGRELYKSEEMDLIYSKERLEKIIPFCEDTAIGKLRLKDSIKNLLGVRE